MGSTGGSGSGGAEYAGRERGAERPADERYGDERQREREREHEHEREGEREGDGEGEGDVTGGRGEKGRAEGRTGGEGGEPWAGRRLRVVIANRLWSVFGIAFGVSVVSWVLAGLARLWAEEGGECRLAELRGNSGLVRTWDTVWPPSQRCTFVDGTTLSSAGFLVPVFWAAAVLALLCGVLALAHELWGFRNALAGRRLRAVVVSSGLTLVMVGGIGYLIAGTEGSEACRASRTGLAGPAARTGYRLFPPQRVCEYPGGGRVVLVPGPVVGATWTLTAVVVTAGLGWGAAVRHGRARRGGATPPSSPSSRPGTLSLADASSASGASSASNISSASSTSHVSPTPAAAPPTPDPPTTLDTPDTPDTLDTPDTPDTSPTRAEESAR
ncbi:hypothetical protein AB0J21_04600 [Streptomyces sp. NPDC049954]|uniref:hypothetical protein n=1 Tax=Streptomyces sp. NPDC049954 TaxID=3155779 RepID=UPI003432CBFD